MQSYSYIQMATNESPQEIKQEQAVKQEYPSPRSPLSDVPTTPTASPPTPHRSWSCGILDGPSKRISAFPGRTPLRRHDKSYQAAVRAAADQLRSPKLRATRTLSESPRSTAESSGGTRRPPVALTQAPDAAGLASGPAAGLQQQPGTSETTAQIIQRYTQQPSRLPVYLIRTDLRYAPALDIVTVYMEMPGLGMEDVSLKIGNRSNGIKHLVVTAVSRPPLHRSDEMAMQERVFGIFTRSLVVPPHVTASDIKAEMSNGLLVLRIPGTKFEPITIVPGA